MTKPPLHIGEGSADIIDHCCRLSRRLAMALAMLCTTCTSTIMMITAVHVTVWSNF